jgi:hypothetical protein
MNGTDVQFDTNSFLEVQWNIAVKYDDPPNFFVPHVGIKPLTKRMDNFYARINGEIAEVYRELFKDEINKEDLIRESVDIIMYLGSQNMLVDTNLRSMFSDCKYGYDYRFSFPHQIIEYIPFQDYALKIMAHVHELNTRLIEIYPVEWHEKVPEYNDVLLRNMFEDSIELMTDIMNIILAMLINLTSGDIALINRMIHEKQQKALARKPV